MAIKVAHDPSSGPFHVLYLVICAPDLSLLRTRMEGDGGPGSRHVLVE